MVGRNNLGFLVCSTQAYTSSLPVTALVQERGKHHVSSAHHRWCGDTQGGLHFMVVSVFQSRFPCLFSGFLLVSKNPSS